MRIPVCAVALATAASFGAVDLAHAAPPIGPQVTVDADYSYVNLSNVAHLNDYGGAVGAELPLGSSAWSVQVDGSGHGLSGTNGGGSFSQWGVDSALTWNNSQGRIGAAVAYDGLNLAGNNFNFVTYGVYGDYYLGKAMTVGGKVGGVTESGGGLGSATQAYIGGHVVGYFMPNLAMSATADFIGGGNAGRVTAVGARIEYLFSQKTPFSVYVGADYANVGGFHTTVGSVGVRYRFGASGASLEDRQRTGVDEWGPVATSLRYAF